MEYFFDNCISYRFPEMLRALQVNAVALRERFPEDISDVELFAKLAEGDYVFIGSDIRQRTREQEATALKAANISAVYFGPFWTKMDFWQQAAWLTKHWPTIESVVNGLQRGSVVKFSQNGKARPF